MIHFNIPPETISDDRAYQLLEQRFTHVEDRLMGLSSMLIDIKQKLEALETQQRSWSNLLKNLPMAMIGGVISAGLIWAVI